MTKTRMFLFLTGFLLLFSSSVLAQVTVIDAKQLRSYVREKKDTVLVDTRTREEYEQTHIPGAVNIMPDEMKDKAPRLLKKKKGLIIFYCRGME